MTSREKVEVAHPEAIQQRYQTHGGKSYYLIFSTYRINSQVRLGEWATSSKA